MNKKGIFLVMLSALLYGFAPVLCSLSYNYGNNPVTLTFFRSFFVIIILAMIMVYKKISFRCEKGELLKIIAVALFGSIMTTLLLNFSYLYIGVGTATTLHFLYPLFVTLICHFVYHDAMGKKQLIALAIALLGVLLFIDINDLGKIQGIIMALISGITFSIYLVGIEKFGLSKMNSYKLSFYLALTVASVLLITDLFTHEIIFIQPAVSYLLMLGVAITAQLLAVICLQQGIDLLGSSLASLFSMFEPVSSVIFGAIFLNEIITLPQIGGCALILFGVLLLVKK